MTDFNGFSDMTIAVVDDHDLIREGINAMLSAYGGVEISRFGTATQLIEVLDAGRGYDLYIVDIELPDIDGFELIGEIRALDSAARIMVCTVHDEIWTVRKLKAYNVDAIVYKSGLGTEILNAIREIAAGRRYYSREAMQMLADVGDDSRYPSPRELEVLHHISLGRTTKEIADALFVSENTVEAHRKSLLHKLGASNAADLIAKSVRQGYLLNSGILRNA